MEIYHRSDDIELCWLAAHYEEELRKLDAGYELRYQEEKARNPYIDIIEVNMKYRNAWLNCPVRKGLTEKIMELNMFFYPQYLLTKEEAKQRGIKWKL